MLTVTQIAGFIGAALAGAASGMKGQARRSGLVMGFDTHMIAGGRACPHQLGSLTRPSPARQARTMPGPWTRSRR
jgi:hypothetical protein